MKMKLLATAAAMAVSLLVAGQVQAQEKLTVWWGKGFYKAEDAKWGHLSIGASTADGQTRQTGMTAATNQC